MVHAVDQLFVTACGEGGQHTCVAMPAWSVPGSHRVGRPRMRLKRTMMSCSVTNMACPMCRRPVTFGGGMAAHGTHTLSHVAWPVQHMQLTTDDDQRKQRGKVVLTYCERCSCTAGGWLEAPILLPPVSQITLSPFLVLRCINTPQVLLNRIAQSTLLQCAYLS